MRGAAVPASGCAVPGQGKPRMTRMSALPPAAPPLPTHCDVLVIGAGPAGSACAQRLASQGVDVVLADQQVFPRDKVCGDGLIPDAHAALRRLGVHEQVASLAQPVHHVRCIGPRGGHVDVQGTLSVLPRKQLDEILVRAAERAGARLAMPQRFVAPLLDGERVVGAQLRGDDGIVRDVTARSVVLATGASAPPLVAAGVCTRRTPSGIALRGYFRHEGLARQITQLQLVWHPRLRGGYGWIFPAPGGVFNVGTGLTGSHEAGPDGGGRMLDRNLRQMLADFAEVYAPAGTLLREGEPLGEVKGAPLRCTLRGAMWSRPGMLVAGEAAGSTYSFSGEGIGKALETGLAAADAWLAQRPATAGADDAPLRAAYEAALRALQPRFDLYETASRVNRHPWLADLVVWRANKSPRIQRRLSGVLEETQNPGRLFTVRGLTKLLFE